MSKRQFVSILFWLILVNLLIKAIFIFGIDLQVQNRVGPASYGLYFTLLNLCYIFQIINDFGLNLLHNTDTASHGKVRVERWQQILRLKVLLSLTYSLVIFAAAYALGYGYTWKILVWLIANNILVSLIAVFRAGISGTARYKSDAFLSVMDKMIMILVCGVLLLQSQNFRIEWFIWAQTFSLVITAITAWWITSRFIDRTQSSIDRTPAEIIFKDTLPFTVATLLMFIYSRADTILIEKLLPNGTHEAGVYAAGFRFLDAANMIAFLFTPLLIPMYARLQSEREETLQLMRLAAGLMICMVATISLAGFWWGWPIMQLSYGTVDAQWVMTFRLLILTHIPIGLMYIFGSYLTAVGQLKSQNFLFLFSVALNIGLNLYLIPRFGTVGAAVTACITQGLTTIGLLVLGHRQLEEKPSARRILNVVIYFSILTVSGWILESSTLYWMVEIGMFLLISVFAAFLFKLLNWGSAKRLVESYVRGKE